MGPPAAACAAPCVTTSSPPAAAAGPPPPRGTRRGEQRSPRRGAGRGPAGEAGEAGACSQQPRQQPAGSHPAPDAGPPAAGATRPHRRAGCAHQPRGTHTGPERRRSAWCPPAGVATRAVGSAAPVFTPGCASSHAQHAQVSKRFREGPQWSAVQRVSACPLRELHHRSGRLPCSGTATRCEASAHAPLELAQQEHCWGAYQHSRRSCWLRAGMPCCPTPARAPDAACLDCARTPPGRLPVAAVLNWQQAAAAVGQAGAERPHQAADGRGHPVVGAGGPGRQCACRAPRARRWWA